MAKRVYELAAELGMRTERLMELLDKSGFALDSVFDEMEPEMFEAIGKKARSERSLWNRLRRRFRRRKLQRLYDAATSLSEEELEHLDALVARHESSLAQGDLSSLFESGPAGATEKPQALPGEEEPVERVPAKETSPEPDKTSAVQDEVLNEERLLTTLDKVAQRDEKIQPADEPPTGEDRRDAGAELVSAESIAAEKQATPESEPLESVPSVSQEEETEKKAAVLEETVEVLPVAEDSGIQPPGEKEAIQEESGKAETQDTQPVLEEPVTVDDLLASASTNETPETLQAPEEAPLTADELLEEQLGRFESESTEEPERPAEAEVPVEASVSETPPETAAAESISEDRVSEPAEPLFEKEEPVEAEMEPQAAVSQEEPEPQTQAEGSVPSTAVTIDDLLGETVEAEEGQEEEEKPQPAAAQVEPSRAVETGEGDETGKEQLLDTSSLLGLEFAEEEEEKAIPETPAKGVSVEDLLGLQEGKKEEAESKPSRPSSLLARLIERIGGDVRDFLQHPGRFLKSLSNLELIFLSALVLAILSAGMFTAYRWYNFYRPGVDTRFFKRAELLRQAGRYDEALEMYRCVLKYHPGSSLVGPTHFGMADAFYRQEQYRDAIPSYESALALDERARQDSTSEGFPDFLVVPEARLNLARSLLKVGFYEVARERLTALARDYPGQDIGEESRLILGDLYATWARQENQPQKYRNAVAEYNLALNEYPDSRRRVELLTRVGNAYRELYGSQPEEQKDIALLLEAVGEFEEAIRQAERQDRPPEEVARIKVAWAETQKDLGAADRAIELYDRLLKTDLPLDLQVEVLENVARAHLAQGDFQEAERRARQLMDHNPGDAGLALAYYVLGDAEWERPGLQRDFTRMIQYYQKALQLDDNSGPGGAHSQRAFMRMTNVLYMSERKYEEAAEKYQVIIDRYPKGPYTYRAKFFMAECLRHLGRCLEAADAYDQCIKDFETTQYIKAQYFEDALYRRAESLYAAKRSAEAISAYQEALRTLNFPDTDRALKARRELAECYLAQQDYPQAEKILVHLLQRYPQADSGGQVSFQLGQLRQDLFDYDGAQAIYLDLIQRTSDLEVQKAAFDRLAETYKTKMEGVRPEEVQALRIGAISTYRAMQKRFPRVTEADLEIGKLYRDQGENQRAEQHLKSFLDHAQAEDRQAEGTVLLGELMSEAGRDREAQRLFQLVTELPVLPGDKSWRAQAAYGLAEVVRKQGKLKEAKAGYQRVVENFPDTPWAKEADWKLRTVDWQMEVSQADQSTSL